MAYTDYSSLFHGAEQKYGLPPGTLSGVGYVESRYNPQAVSPKGAQGLMQFMPATAKGVGLSNPFDPSASIDAAGNLLSQNMKATGGDLRSALMMYNAGTNRAKWNPAYANDVLSHAQQSPQVGGQPPMPPQMPPVSLASLMNAPMQTNINAAPVQPSLGALSGGLPQGQIPAKSQSKFTAGNIMGVLGDALSAYGGRQPTFAPFLREQQMLGQQQNFEREKFNQELAMRMYAMTHPEKFMEANAFANADPQTRQNFVDFENVSNPQVADTQLQNGSFVRNIIPRVLPPKVGEVRQGYQFMGGDPAQQNNWKAVQ